jgi:hypothetical protein
MLRAALVALPLLVTVACAPVERDPACVQAEACDQVLEEPFEDFNADDPVFGDDLNGDGKTGVEAGDINDVGTCWQNADTAAVCAKQCQDFLKEQADLAAEDDNQAVVDACTAK